MLQAIMQSLINIHLYIKNKNLPRILIRAIRRVTLCIAHSAKGNPFGAQLGSAWSDVRKENLSVGKHSKISISPKT